MMSTGNKMKAGDLVRSGTEPFYSPVVCGSPCRFDTVVLYANKSLRIVEYSTTKWRRPEFVEFRKEGGE